jgi:predicted nucleotidyltransferase
VVFGSRARGDAAPDSDMDIFIEVPALTKQLRTQIDDIVWEIGFEHDLVITTLITSTALLINSPLADNPILLAIDVEGVPV